MRFFIELSYRGENYHGWQIQPSSNTVQQEINQAISLLLKENIIIVGAGRTDAGVHAKKMFAHFDYAKNFQINDLIFRLNQLLPEDIAIHDIFRVIDDKSARFDALSRTYQYYVTYSKNPFVKDAYLIHNHLDLELMNLASKYLIGKKDFTSFAKVNKQVHTNICHVISSEWIQKEDLVIFTIKSDRFLWNMVRSIVGTLLEVGRNNIKPEEIEYIMSKKNRSAAGFSVPAKALFLTDIEYPKDIFYA